MALFDKKTSTKTTAKAAKAAVVSKAEGSMKDLYATDSKSAKSKVVAKSANARRHSQAYRVLVRPIITEKGTALAASAKYLFAVELNANKISVSKAIEELYGIRPVKVNMVRLEGKTKVRGRIVGKRKDWKKAVVTLPAGKTINVYEGV
jgi:large subunit ribosomal protein L23